MQYPNNYKYSKEHEWAEDLGNGKVRVGVTHHAQNSLGDIVYLDLPAVGREVKAGEIFGVIESIKAVSDLYAPVGGTVTESNADLVADPVKVNQDPHTSWMIVVDCGGADAASAAMGALMDAAAYTDFVKNL